MTIQHQFLELDITTGISPPGPPILTTNGPVVSSVLNKISLRIPPGHGGTTGICVLWNGVPIVPWGHPENFITGDDDYLEFPIDEQIGGLITVDTFNNDPVNNHTHYLRFDVTPFALTQAPVPGQLVTAVPLA